MEHFETSGKTCRARTDPKPKASQYRTPTYRQTHADKFSIELFETQAKSYNVSQKVLARQNLDSPFGFISGCSNNG